MAKDIGFEDITVSIHASREGGDVPERIFLDLFSVSIHASREGGDSFAAIF